MIHVSINFHVLPLRYPCRHSYADTNMRVRGIQGLAFHPWFMQRFVQCAAFHRTLQHTLRRHWQCSCSMHWQATVEVHLTHSCFRYKELGPNGEVR